MNDLVLIALADEAPALSKLPHVFQTGVGKVNAAIAAARLIERYRPKRIWNFGTAGGLTVGNGLHRCTRFLQRDMQVTALGFSPGETPFESNIVLDLGDHGLTCSSGDSFVTTATCEFAADLVDMEAYALAKACLASSTEFHCYKYISDRADDDSHLDWRANIHRGEPYYVSVLQQHSLA